MYAKFEGIVLFVRPYREKDALVKIFTKDFGTRMFFIKGYQAANHPLKKHLLPLSQHQYVGRVNDSGFSFLKEGATLNAFRQLQADPFLQAHAAYASQLIDASIEDHQVDLQHYHLLEAVLTKLNQVEEGRPVTLWLEINLLNRFGLQVDWLHCQECGGQARPMDFSMVRQGVLCAHHLQADPYRLQLRKPVLSVIQTLSQIQLQQLGEVQVSDQTYESCQAVMQMIYQEWVGMHLKSASYLQALYRTAKTWQPSGED